ncbi:hypothetical protein KFL_001210060 [Klebsormidium nitens]|uniref:Patatin n=1 Tax=Klebsormidium nitens TaxID=105231 RepID=A0A1Y1HYA0_KLENI|nr:hypothetical protein KFL_001210060 [Klebsormidium nitens]|eukprot:GAQ82712.1 hypothetical protein KFL_001210060 [Klebsormidium nitens]
MACSSALPLSVCTSGLVPSWLPGAFHYSVSSRWTLHVSQRTTRVGAGARSQQERHHSTEAEHDGKRPAWVPHPDTLKYGHKRVLALDGGGIRGIILGVVLEYLEDTILEVLRERHKNENIERKDIYLAEFFDIIAGTSTGGLLALYLASRGRTYDTLGKSRLGLTEKERMMMEEPNNKTYHRKGGATAALQMYRANASNIFKHTVPGYLRWAPVEWISETFLRAKYGSNGIESVLQDVFGADTQSKKSPMLTLKDLSASVVIPSFNTKEISPFTFFYNSCANCQRPGFTFVGNNPKDKYASDELCTFTANFPLWQVARATSAAPTFFPVAFVEHVGPDPKNDEGVKPPIEPLELIDGGVAANDPAFQAVLLQGKMYGASLKAENKKPNWLLPTDFAILSLGTGTIKTAAPQKGGAKLSVVSDLVGKVLMGSASDLVHSYFKAMMANLPEGEGHKPEMDREPPCPYLRIQKTDTSSDDKKEMIKLAQDVLQRAATDDEKQRYKNCLNIMDDVSEANMNMLEHIGEFLGRHITGRVAHDEDGRKHRNLLRDYVVEYVLKPAEVAGSN